MVHPALRPPATGRRARTDPACRGAGAGGGGSAVGGVSDASVGVSGASGGGSVRRLPAPRRSSLDFEPAKPRPPPPRGQLVLTNLRSVERETLLPVVAKLGDVAVVEEVCWGGGGRESGGEMEHMRVVNGEAEEDGMENAEKHNRRDSKAGLFPGSSSFYLIYFNLSFFIFVQSCVFSHAYFGSCFCWPL